MTNKGAFMGECPKCKQTYRPALPASPKPDTDTPVDPGAEGVTELRWALATLDDVGYVAGYRAINSRIATLAAKPIAGMDAGEVEERVARIIAPNCNWSRE